MDLLEDATVTCPYCWESIVLELDLSAGSQTYTEDCSVCCRPIVVRVQVSDEGSYEVQAQAEDE